MDRSEIEERIAIGQAFLTRTDVTAEFKATAAKRIENLKSQLREIEEKEKARFAKPDERAMKSIQTIREMLLQKQAEAKKSRER
jgi:hypothetical protein